MRRVTALLFRVTAVLVGFALVLEGPDLLLIALLDAHLWFPVGLSGGLLSLPLLVRYGTALAPPWTLPAVVDGASVRRAAGYHLLCSVVAAWLWTAPTLRLVDWVAGRPSSLTTSVETLPADPVSAGVGLSLAAFAFFLPAAVLFVRLSTFRTELTLRTTPLSTFLRPAVVALGGYLVGTGFVSFCLVVVFG